MNITREHKLALVAIHNGADPTTMSDKIINELCHLGWLNHFVTLTDKGEKVVGELKAGRNPNAVHFTRMFPGAPAPKRAHPTDAGVDLTSIGYIDKHGTRIETKGHLEIEPGDQATIRTGIQVAIPEGYVGLLVVRSSLGTKLGLSLANNVGVIDADYRGEVLACLRNSTGETQVLKLGERFCQLVVMPVNIDPWVEVDDLDDTQRGAGGFGSTGQ